MSGQDSTGAVGRPVTILTLEDCRRYRHRVSVYCPQCRHWAELDVARLCARGRGPRPLASLGARCRACGATGEVQVKPPAPAWTGYHEMQACTERPEPGNPRSDGGR
jgi:hypothetical protein